MTTNKIDFTQPFKPTHNICDEDYGNVEVMLVKGSTEDWFTGWPAFTYTEWERKEKQPEYTYQQNYYPGLPGSWTFQGETLTWDVETWEEYIERLEEEVRAEAERSGIEYEDPRDNPAILTKKDLI